MGLTLAIGVGIALFGIVGCSPQAAETESRPVQAASAEPAAETTAPAPPSSASAPTATADATAPSPTPTATATATPEPLPERFLADANGNVIPDFIEEQIGFDPAVEACQPEECRGPGGVDPLAPIQENVLVILDSSGSMAADDGTGRPKIDAAREAITQYVLGTPDSLPLGLMVYGHVGSNQPEDQAASCAGIEVFAPLGELTAPTVDATVQQFQPTGYTPVAGSLQAAAPAFAGLEGQANRVILVTDGIETCSGDPVAAAQALHESGVAVTVDVVGFDLPDADAAALRQVAEVTGGTFTDARTGADRTAHFQGLLGRRNDLLAQLACIATSNVRNDGCLTIRAAQANSVIAAEFEIEAIGTPTPSKPTR